METIYSNNFIVPVPKSLLKLLESLADVQQRRDFHPEGDVLTHTKIVVDRLENLNDITLSITALLHDTGKLVTTKFDRKRGHYISHGHEFESLAYVLYYRTWIESNGVDFEDVYYLVKNHMKANFYARGHISRPHKVRLWIENPLYGRMMLHQAADDMLLAEFDKNDYRKILKRIARWKESSIEYLISKEHKAGTRKR